jgi:hypothetical protein
VCSIDFFLSVLQILVQITPHHVINSYLCERVLDLLDDALLLWVAVLVDVTVNSGTSSSVGETSLVSSSGSDVVAARLSLCDRVGCEGAFSTGQSRVAAWSGGVALEVLVGVLVCTAVCDSVSVTKEVFVGGGEKTSNTAGTLLGSAFTLVQTVTGGSTEVSVVQLVATSHRVQKGAEHSRQTRSAGVVLAGVESVGASGARGSWARCAGSLVVARVLREVTYSVVVGGGCTGAT